MSNLTFAVSTYSGGPLVITDLRTQTVKDTLASYDDIYALLDGTWYDVSSVKNRNGRLSVIWNLVLQLIIQSRMVDESEVLSRLTVIEPAYNDLGNVNITVTQINRMGDPQGTDLKIDSTTKIHTQLMRSALLVVGGLVLPTERAEYVYVPDGVSRMSQACDTLGVIDLKMIAPTIKKLMPTDISVIRENGRVVGLKVFVSGLKLLAFAGSLFYLGHGLIITADAIVLDIDNRYVRNAILRYYTIGKMTAAVAPLIWNLHASKHGIVLTDKQVNELISTMVSVSSELRVYPRTASVTNTGIPLVYSTHKTPFTAVLTDHTGGIVDYVYGDRYGESCIVIPSVDYRLREVIQTDTPVPVHNHHRPPQHVSFTQLTFIK